MPRILNIAIGSDGTVYGLSENGDVYRWIIKVGKWKLYKTG
jgi:hypothetical protein